MNRRFAVTAAGSSHSNLGGSSLDIFQKTWATYKDVVQGDYMEHRSMTASMTRAINDFLKLHSGKGPESVDIVDVGCGDLALLAPFYRSLPIRSFCGVDLSLPALDLAKKAFHGDVATDGTPKPTSAAFVHQDILKWASLETEADVATDGALIHDYSSGSGPRKFDVVVSSLVVHHLDDDKKGEFLAATFKNRLKAGGVVLMMDVFRKAGEDRETYLERYRRNIASWKGIPLEERESVLDHVVNNDFPAAISDFVERIVPSIGAEAKVIWSDSGDFEKLLVIKPRGQL
jgi:SAM-dependent methyltransferase